MEKKFKQGMNANEYLQWMCGITEFQAKLLLEGYMRDIDKIKE